MKLIKYNVLQCTINVGTDESPIFDDILLEKKVGYNDRNLVIAKAEAYNGEYVIEEGELPKVGSSNFVGCMGYYWKSIDLTNKKIYLCLEQTIPSISTADYTDDTFITPGYAVGDLIAIVNNNKYFSPTARITSIQNNVITYEGNIGFTSINTVSASSWDIDDYSLFVKEKPTIGLVSIKHSGFSAGIANNVLGNGAAGFGGGLLVYGDFGFGINTGNEVAWAAFGYGYGNKSLGFYSSTGGRGNTNRGECGRMAGQGNTATEKAFGCDTSGKENYTDAAWIHLSGVKNKVYDKIQKSQGSDVSGEDNLLDGAKNVRMHGKSNKVLGSDSTSHWGGAQSEVGGLENVLDGRETGATNIHMHGEKNYVSHRNVDMGGKGNKSSAPNQIIRGTYNDFYNEFGDVDSNILLMLGNGESDTKRSNAFKVDKQGNGTFSGDVFAKGNKLVTQDDVDYKFQDFINTTLAYDMMDLWDAIHTKAPGHIYSQTELTGEFPPLESGQLYLVYE